MDEGRSKQELERQLRVKLSWKAWNQRSMEDYEQRLSAAQKELSQPSLSKARKSELEKEVKFCEEQIQEWKKDLLGSEEEIKKLQDALGQLTSASQKPDSSSQKETQNDMSRGNTQHTEAYYKAIKDKITLMIKVVRLVHAGIPRSGKSTTIKRLVGDILNILDISPSTGVGKQEGQIIVTRKMNSDMVAIGKSSEWSRLKGFIKEDSLLKQLLKTKKKSDLENQLAASASVKASSRHVHNEATREEIYKLMSLSSVGTKDPAEVEDLEELENLLNNLLVLLINTDTGGQSEFLDMLCALIMGPSLYLLYHNLIDPLDKPFDTYFADDKGNPTEKVKSTDTVEECLFRILSSIDCFSKPKEESTIQKDPKYFIRSKAIFVGTHRDEVKSDKELFKKQNYLKKKVEKLGVCTEGTLLFLPNGEPILAVDNFKGNDDERKDMKDTLTDLINRHFDEIPIPAAWLILSLYMRKDLQANRIMSLKDCEEQAMKLEMDSEELKTALWFLHHCLGLILYYPEVKEIKNKIFCDVQVVYDSITQLIVHTFTTKSGQHGITKNFREKGMFSDHDLECAMRCGDSKPDLLPLHELVALLKHLKILAVIPDEESQKGKTYFMPCVLNNATGDELKSMLKTVKELKDNPAPLMLQYDCGYVPVGIFPHMIADIASRWKLAEDKVIRKNMIQFSVGENEVIFTSCPSNITVALSRDRICKTSNEQICPDIRGEIVSSLKNVAKCMNYKFDMKYKFGFKCNHNDLWTRFCNFARSLLFHPPKGHLCLYKRNHVHGNHVQCQSDYHKDNLTESQQVWFPKQCKDGPIAVGIARPATQTSNRGWFWWTVIAFSLLAIIFAPSYIVPSSKGEYCVCMFPHCTQDHQVHEYYHSLNVFTIDSCIEQTSVDLGRIDATTQLGCINKPACNAVPGPSDSVKKEAWKTEKQASKAGEETERVIASFEDTPQLTSKDHSTISRLLNDLNREKLRCLGGALGLLDSNLQRMRNLLADMVSAWLNGDDNVTNMDGVGDTRSWEGLIQGLLKCSMKGTADKVRKSLE